MILRDEYPAGVPCWIGLAVPDTGAAARFYGGLFGWTFDDRGSHLVAQLDGHDVAGVRSPRAGSAAALGWCTYVAVEAVDESARRVAEAGGEVVAEAVDVPGTSRIAVCADPDGAAFGLWQPSGRAGAHVVNAPGTWNWSDLETPDVERAKAFYGAVFGWRSRTVEFGAHEATMWCVPGYGDFLATLDPALRARHDDPSVPPGFSDAIGWLSSIDGPARWTVTFAVEDTMGIATRAAELGGTVDVAPYDAGGATVAVLRDPDGAPFTVSHYQPPA